MTGLCEIKTNFRFPVHAESFRITWGPPRGFCDVVGTGEGCRSRGGGAVLLIGNLSARAR